MADAGKIRGEFFNTIGQEQPRSLSAQRFQVRRPPRYRDTGRCFQLCVTEQQLDRSDVLGALVDQRRLRAPERVSAVPALVQPDAGGSALYDPAVLPYGQGAPLSSTWEKIAIGAKITPRDPGGDRFTCCLRDLELHWTLRLALHVDGTTGDHAALVQVSDSPRDQVAAAELTVDGQVEQRQVTALFAS